MGAGVAATLGAGAVAAGVVVVTTGVKATGAVGAAVSDATDAGADAGTVPANAAPMLATTLVLVGTGGGTTDAPFALFCLSSTSGRIPRQDSRQFRAPRLARLSEKARIWQGNDADKLALERDSPGPSRNSKRGISLMHSAAHKKLDQS